MSEVITAIYENGILRPLEPLLLTEHQTVRLQVLSSTVDESVEQARLNLLKAGILTPPSGRSEIPPISDTERRQLADTLGQSLTKPLSEIIIAERGE